MARYTQDNTDPSSEYWNPDPNYQYKTGTPQTQQPVSTAYSQPSSTSTDASNGGQNVAPYAKIGNLEDTWFNFLKQGGYAGGQSGRGAGFFSGGNQYRGNLGGIVDAFNKQYGTNATPWGEDMVNFGGPWGARDVITSGGDWWMSPTGETANGAGGNGAGNGAGGSGISAGASGTGATSYDSMTQALLDRITKMDQQAAADRDAQKQKADALYGQLNDRAKQSLAINRNDPIIRAQADAYAANQQRAQRDYLSNLAEKQGPLANLEGQQRITSEQLGQNTGAFEANLMGQELTARRKEIQDALDGMRGMLSQDQQQALQEQLSQLDAAIKQTGMAQNQNQFGQDLGYRYAQLGQQGSQFDRNLGLQYDTLDNAMLRQILNGLG